MSDDEAGSCKRCDVDGLSEVDVFTDGGVVAITCRRCGDRWTIDDEGKRAPVLSHTPDEETKR